MKNLKNYYRMNNLHNEKHIKGERAYKLLAAQYNISMKRAKKMIDMGIVNINGRRLEVARQLLSHKTKFDISEIIVYKIYEDNDLLVLDKSIGIESYSLENRYAYCKLINRLDRDTSGVILMAKNEITLQKAICEFQQKRVKKTYFALVEGKIYDTIHIEKRIATRKGVKAKSYISKNGDNALSIVYPIRIFNNTTLVEINIITGKTHQIRVHLASIKHPIVGDIIYNDSYTKNAKRLMLHCYKTIIFNKEFISQTNIDSEFDLNIYE